MVRTIRLDKELETSLKQMTRKTGQSASEVIRDALRLRAAQLNALPNTHPWSAYVGKVAGRGRSVAKRADEEFSRLLSRRSKKKADRS